VSLAVDTGYDLTEDIVPGPWRRDSVFMFWRAEQAVLDAATACGCGRILDVACGTADQAGRLARRGCQAWGLEPSPKMLGLARHRRRERGDTVFLVQGIAEQLPFHDNSFDTVVCQGSLDHFARPHLFMAEAARILRPEGRAVIALANFESLSCRLSRAIHEAKEMLGLPLERGRRPYWQIPPNHTFRGDLRVVKSLGGPCLEMEECYGLSQMWLFRRWSLLLESLPAPMAWRLLRGLDRLAYRLPALADMIISVWRRRPLEGGKRGV
jgi:SAM-dependent methyltransferase